jgi:hypothetical protein
LTKLFNFPFYRTEYISYHPHQNKIGRKGNSEENEKLRKRERRED